MRRGLRSEVTRRGLWSIVSLGKMTSMELREGSCQQETGPGREDDRSAIRADVVGLRERRWTEAREYLAGVELVWCIFELLPV